jgi:hypothetical protein
MHESLRARARRKASHRIAAGLDVGRRRPTPDEVIANLTNLDPKLYILIATSETLYPNR